jgi:hypothetical protein
MSGSRYDALRHYLANQGKGAVTLTFREVEKILGFSLPDSARTHRPWWANEDRVNTRHTQSRAWTAIGRTATPDLVNETVRFE